MQIDTIVREWIVEVIRAHPALLAIAVRQRAKFEGWLKYELASTAELRGARDVEVEAALEKLAASRSDLAFYFEGKRYDIELKTCNTNWRIDGVLPLTRPITKNIDGIIVDAKKLQNCPGEGIVAFCMFPVPCGDPRWTEYLNRISNALGLSLSAGKHSARVPIAIGDGITAEVVVIAFSVPRSSNLTAS
jgi:hypothetical protein